MFSDKLKLEKLRNNWKNVDKTVGKFLFTQNFLNFAYEKGGKLP